MNQKTSVEENQKGIPSHSRLRVVLAFGILAAVVLVILFTLMVSSANREKYLVENGDRVAGQPTGKVFVELGEGYKYRIEYTYRAEGKTYSVKGRHFWNVESDAKKYIAANGDVVVYYLPDEPSKGLILDN